MPLSHEIESNFEIVPNQHTLRVPGRGTIVFTYSEENDVVTILSTACDNDDISFLYDLVSHMVTFLTQESLQLSPLVSQNTEIRTMVMPGMPLEDAYRRIRFEGPSQEGYMTTIVSYITPTRMRNNQPVQGGKTKRKRISERRKKRSSKKSTKKSNQSRRRRKH
jgi:hypothetical protein